MIEDDLKNPQSYRIQQSTSRSDLPSYTSNNILKDIMWEKCMIESTGLPGWLQQEEARDSWFWLDNQWRLATSQLIQIQLFFFQNYQLDLPLDKRIWVNAASVQVHCDLPHKLHVRGLQKQAWAFSLTFITDDSPQHLKPQMQKTLWLFCWIRELKRISGPLHSEGQRRSGSHSRSFTQTRCWLSPGSPPRSSHPKPYHNGSKLELLQ